MRAAVLALALAFLAGSALGQQPADQEWLASTRAAEFRGRVVQLALIYGESSGIDLRGFKVLTRQASKAGAGCADVEITTFKGDDVVRRETVHACRAH
jgi:hypothetical protein